MEEVKQENRLTLEGKQFVITGSVNHFANRAELKEYIEQRGGKVTGSVTSKTDYLINNDVTSNSSKNKKARELGDTDPVRRRFSPYGGRGIIKDRKRTA